MTWWKRRTERKADELRAQLRGAEAARLSGRLAEAERGFLAVFNISDKHPVLRLDALNGLGMVRVSQRRYAEGFEYLRQAMALIDEQGWQKTRLAASTLNNIASLRWTEGNRAAASAMFERANALLVDVTTPNPCPSDFSVRLAIMENLVAHYTIERRFQEAESCLTVALRLIDPFSGKYPRNWASLLTKLVTLYASQERWADAVKGLQVAVRRWERDCDTNLPEFAEILSHLGQLECHTGEFEDGERQLRRAIGIVDKLSPGRHEHTVASVCARMGLLHLERKDPSAAEGFFKRQLAAMQAIPEPAPHELIVAINNVGVAQRDGGHFAEAEANLSTALEQARQLLREHETPLHALNLANVLKNFAQLRQRQGRTDDAVAMAREANNIASSSAFAASPKAQQILEFTSEMVNGPQK